MANFTSSDVSLTPRSINRFSVSSTSKKFSFDGTQTPGRISHCIPHIWRKRYGLCFRNKKCNHCHKWLRTGYRLFFSYSKCTVCRIKVHEKCMYTIGASCGMSPELLRGVVENMLTNSNRNSWITSEMSLRPSLTTLLSTNRTMNFTPTTSSNNAVSTVTLRRQFLVIDSQAQENEGPKTLSTRKRASSDSDVLSQHFARPSSAKLQRIHSSPAKMQWSQYHSFFGPDAWTEAIIAHDDLKFENDDVISNGRFGQVRYAKYFGNVVVKYLSMRHVPKHERVEQFRAEFRHYLSVRHDCFPILLGFCQEHDDKFAMVTTKMNGVRTLEEILCSGEMEICPSIQLNIAKQLCQGMSYLHAKGIVHRDLRVSNLFLDANWGLRICNIGLISAKRLSWPPKRYGFDVPNTWLLYLAPEQTRQLAADFRDIDFDEASDIFAFGTVLYNLLYHELPWRDVALVPNEYIIYHMAHCCTYPLPQRSVNATLKSAIAQCWSQRATRPSFEQLTFQIKCLPRPFSRCAPLEPRLIQHRAMSGSMQCLTSS